MKTDNVKKSFVYNLFLKLVIFIIPLIVTPYLSRVLTKTGVGDYSYSSSIVTYFTLIISFGFTDYGTKSIAKYRDNKEDLSSCFWNIVFSKIILLFLILIAYIFVVSLFSFGDDLPKSVYYSYIPLLIGTGINITFLYQGIEKFKILSFINVIFKIVSLILIFLLVKSANDLIIYVIIQSSYTLIVSLFLFAFSRKIISKPNFNRIKIIDSFKESLIYFLPTVAVTLYTVVDKTMIGAMASKEELAYYQQAYKLIEIPCNAVNAIVPVMLARMSYLFKIGNQTEIQNKTKQLFQLMSLMIFPCMSGLYLIADIFVPQYFGVDFSPAISVLYILIPLIFITTISNNIRNIYYAPQNKLLTLTIILFIGALVNLILNYFIIPRYGANGAAFTSIISELLIFIFLIVFSFKKIKYFDLIKSMIKPGIASIIMFVCLFLLNKLLYANNVRSMIVFIVDIGLGVIIYLIMCLVLKEAYLFSAFLKIKNKFIKKSIDKSK